MGALSIDLRFEQKDIIMNKMSLEEQIAVYLVWTLPNTTTITIGQIKEIAPVMASYIERLGDGGNMSEAEVNSYERVKTHIKNTYPEIYEEASLECHNNNSQSMATILIAAIDKLAAGDALEKDG